MCIALYFNLYVLFESTFTLFLANLSVEDYPLRFSRLIFCFDPDLDDPPFHLSLILRCFIIITHICILEYVSFYYVFIHLISHVGIDILWLFSHEIRFLLLFCVILKAFVRIVLRY